MPTSLKVSGGGVPIGFIAPLNSQEDIYEDPKGGGTWLRSGVVTNDYNLYPDANINLAVFFGDFFSVAGQSTDPECVVWDGTNFWVIDRITRVAFQYDSLGAYTGVSSSISGAISTPAGAVWDGTHFYVSDNTSEDVEQFDATFTSTGVSFSVVAQIPSQLFGLAWDGTYFYIGTDADDTIHRYDSSFTYTGFSFSFATETAQSGADILFFEGYLWLMNIAGDCFQYDLDGKFTGNKFKITDSSELTLPRSLEAVGEDIWIVGDNNNIVSKFEKYIGIQFIEFDNSDSGKPLFVRVT